MTDPHSNDDQMDLIGSGELPAPHIPDIIPAESDSLKRARRCRRFPVSIGSQLVRSPTSVKFVHTSSLLGTGISRSEAGQAPR